MPRSFRASPFGRRLVLPLIVLSSTALGQVVEFGDDFETGTLLTTDSPPGRWTSRSGTGSPVTSSTLAAHRGLRGARVVDSTMGGPTSLDFLIASLTTRTGDAYVRTWLRFTNPTSASTYPLGLFSGLTQQCTTELEFTGSAWNLDGFSQFASYSGVTASQPFTAGVWHLVEFAQLGAGSASGRRRAWLDGDQVVDAAADLSGGRVNSISLGHYSTSSGFTGITDYDDVRVAATPHVSTFALSASNALAEGCAVVTMALRDSLGGSPVAPYQLVFEVDAGGAAIFSGSGCTGPTSTVSVDAGVSAVTFGVSAPAPGIVVVSASHGDLLGAPGAPITFSARPPDATCNGDRACASLQCVGGRCALGDGGLPDGGVRPAPDGGAVDAGVDAGAPSTGDGGLADAGGPNGGDGGVVDGGGPSPGADAGSVDAGIVNPGSDGGLADAGLPGTATGIGAPGKLAVGCECEHGGPLVGWWLSAAAIAWARARRERRTSSGQRRV